MFKFPQKGKIRLSLVCSILLASNLFAQENKKVTELDNLVIVADEQIETIIKAELKKIPGGTNFVNLATIPTSQTTLNDILSREPGIMMQEFFGGNDQPRLNIRGSAIQANPVNSGTNLLYDGLSINQADGSFVIGVLDPLQHSAVSIYRGSNAMSYSSASLGGAINFIPKSGLNSSSFLNLQVGSHNSQNLNLGIGGVKNKLDYYAYGGFSKSDGFRAQNDSERKNLSLNIGYKISDTIENRTLVNFTDNFFHIPFTVQKQIASQHPTAIIGDGYATSFPAPFPSGTPLEAVFNARGGWDGIFNIHKRKPHRDTEQLRVSNKTTFKVDNQEHQIAFFAQKMDDTFTDPFTHFVSDNQNTGINLNTKGSNILKNNDSYNISLSYNKGSMPGEYWVNSAVDGSKVFKYADLDRDADNLFFNLQYNIPATKNIEFVTDLQWIKSTRDISGTASTPMSQGGFDNVIQNLNKKYSYNSLNPKLGIIVKTSNTSNIYANVSKSIEVPTFNQLVNTSVVPLIMPNSTMPPFSNAQLASGANLVELNEQKAITYEIGTSGSYNDLSWQASYYYSKVEDELITQVDVTAVNGSTFNYPKDTIHQGLELGLTYELAKNIFNTKDTITTNLVYNYNNFKFDGGVYKGNQIAGVPKQTIHLELAYKFGDKFLIAPNIKIQPNDNYIDHSNSVKQDSFSLLGLKLAYNPTKNLSFYADFNNLTDEVYESTYVIRGKADLSSPTFLPGDGFNATAGIKYTW